MEKRNSNDIVDFCPLFKDRDKEPLTFATVWNWCPSIWLILRFPVAKFARTIRIDTVKIWNKKFPFSQFWQKFKIADLDTESDTIWT